MKVVLCLLKKELMSIITKGLFSVLILSVTISAQSQSAWQKYRGEAGTSGWRCHVIQPDPHDDGPDGINLYDWDGDGDTDLFSNAEEGHYSRLYFNPGKDDMRNVWSDFIEFRHGQCEDSGIGDLDNDGYPDYVANGGWIFFNPGEENVRDTSKWIRMTLFDHEQRVPTVADVDGDGLSDLIVGAQEWYRQPVTGKHEAANWNKYRIGRNRWPMNCIIYDVDKDNDIDIVVPDRGVEVCWYVNPGRERITDTWERKTIHPFLPMFMTIADINSDNMDDFIVAGDSSLLILLRTKKTGIPIFNQVLIPRGGKGVAVLDLDGHPDRKEILVIPEYDGEIWFAIYNGDPREIKNWRDVSINIPGAETRRKKDNAWLEDIDKDGDLDILTTEENGGWGIIWFENPGIVSHVNL